MFLLGDCHILYTNEYITQFNVLEEYDTSIFQVKENLHPQDGEPNVKKQEPLIEISQPKKEEKGDAQAKELIEEHKENNFEVPIISSEVFAKLNEAQEKIDNPFEIAKSQVEKNNQESLIFKPAGVEIIQGSDSKLIQENGQKEMEVGLNKVPVATQDPIPEAKVEEIVPINLVVEEANNVNPINEEHKEGLSKILIENLPKEMPINNSDINGQEEKIPINEIKPEEKLIKNEVIISQVQGETQENTTKHNDPVLVIPEPNPEVKTEEIVSINPAIKEAKNVDPINEEHKEDQSKVGNLPKEMPINQSDVNGKEQKIPINEIKPEEKLVKNEEIIPQVQNGDKQENKIIHNADMPEAKNLEIVSNEKPPLLDSNSMNSNTSLQVINGKPIENKDNPPFEVTPAKEEVNKMRDLVQTNPIDEPIKEPQLSKEKSPELLDPINIDLPQVIPIEQVKEEIKEVDNNIPVANIQEIPKDEKKIEDNTQLALLIPKEDEAKNDKQRQELDLVKNKIEVKEDSKIIQLNFPEEKANPEQVKIMDNTASLADKNSDIGKSKEYEEIKPIQAIPNQQAKEEPDQNAIIKDDLHDNIPQNEAKKQENVFDTNIISGPAKEDAHQIIIEPSIYQEKVAREIKDNKNIEKVEEKKPDPILSNEKGDETGQEKIVNVVGLLQDKPGELDPDKKVDLEIINEKQLVEANNQLDKEKQQDDTDKIQAHEDVPKALIEENSKEEPMGVAEEKINLEIEDKKSAFSLSNEKSIEVQPINVDLLQVKVNEAPVENLMPHNEIESDKLESDPKKETKIDKPVQEQEDKFIHKEIIEETNKEQPNATEEKVLSMEVNNIQEHIINEDNPEGLSQELPAKQENKEEMPQGQNEVVVEIIPPKEDVASGSGIIIQEANNIKEPENSQHILIEQNTKIASEENLNVEPVGSDNNEKEGNNSNKLNETPPIDGQDLGEVINDNPSNEEEINNKSTTNQEITNEHPIKKSEEKLDSESSQLKLIESEIFLREETDVQAQQKISSSKDVELENVNNEQEINGGLPDEEIEAEGKIDKELSEPVQRESETFVKENHLNDDIEKQNKSQNEGEANVDFEDINRDSEKMQLQPTRISERGSENFSQSFGTKEVKNFVDPEECNLKEDEVRDCNCNKEERAGNLKGYVKPLIEAKEQEETKAITKSEAVFSQKFSIQKEVKKQSQSRVQARIVKRLAKESSMSNASSFKGSVKDSNTNTKQKHKESTTEKKLKTPQTEIKKGKQPITSTKKEKKNNETPVKDTEKQKPETKTLTPDRSNPKFEKKIPGLDSIDYTEDRHIKCECSNTKCAIF